MSSLILFYSQFPQVQHVSHHICLPQQPCMCNVTVYFVSLGVVYVRDVIVCMSIRIPCNCCIHIIAFLFLCVLIVLGYKQENVDKISDLIFSIDVY